MKTIYLLSLLLPVFAQAKIFSNQFIEFQLPEKWECQLDGTEWVCQSTDEQKKRDAIIVLAAKIKKVGMDELPVYMEHLKKPAQYTSLSGESVVSEPRYVKEIDIASKTWIDSLHLASEIPDFYTRYLATVESDLGILVTFSVRKDKFEEYGPDIEGMTKSIRAFRKSGPVNNIPGGEGIKDVDGVLFPTPGAADGKMNKPASGGGDSAGALVLLLLVAAGGAGFFIWKKRQKK